MLCFYWESRRIANWHTKILVKLSIQTLTGVPTSLPYYPKHHLQNSWPSFRIQSQALSLPEPCAILCRTFWWSVDAASAQWWSTSNRGSSTSSQKFYFRFPNTLIPYKKRLIALNLFPVSHWHEIRDWVFSHKAIYAHIWAYMKVSNWIS